MSIKGDDKSQLTERVFKLSEVSGVEDHINAIHKLDVFSSTSLLKKVGIRVVKFIKKQILR